MANTEKGEHTRVDEVLTMADNSVDKDEAAQLLGTMVGYW